MEVYIERGGREILLRIYGNLLFFCLSHERLWKFRLDAQITGSQNGTEIVRNSKITPSSIEEIFNDSEGKARPEVRSGRGINGTRVSFRPWK